MMLAGCGGKRTLSPEELKKELTRTVPEEGFQPFKEISEGITVKSYSKKRPYDLFAPIPREKPVVEEKEEPAVTSVTVVPEEPVEKPAEPAEEVKIAVVLKPVPEKPVPQESVVKEKTPAVKPDAIPPPEHLALFEGWNGECLVYQITWNSIKFGKGMLACKETSNGYGEIYHIIGLSVPEGRAVSLGMGLYRMDAFIDKKTLLPHYYYQYGKSKNKEDILEIRFDWNKKFYRTKYRKFENGKIYSTKEETVELEDTAHDGISIFYVVRTLDLEQSSSFTFPIAFREIWDLTIRTAGKRMENIPGIGQQEVYVLKPQAENNEGFFTKGAMDLWITADKKRLPVHLEGRVPLGKARMLLISAMKLSPDVTFDANTITNILSRFN